MTTKRKELGGAYFRAIVERTFHGVGPVLALGAVFGLLCWSFALLYLSNLEFRQMLVSQTRYTEIVPLETDLRTALLGIIPSMLWGAMLAFIARGGFRILMRLPKDTFSNEALVAGLLISSFCAAMGGLLVVVDGLLIYSTFLFLAAWLLFSCSGLLGTFLGYGAIQRHAAPNRYLIPLTSWSAICYVIGLALALVV